MAATAPAVTETPAVVRLPGGRLEYTLRRSPRSRGLRVVIHPERGVVVTVPMPGRRGWSDPARHVEAFLAEREPWLRRHLERQARDRAELVARGGLRDGAAIRFRGDLHRLRLVPARTGIRRSTVERIGGADEDELIVHVAPADRRSTAAVLEAWLKPRARAAIEREVGRHAAALGVEPTAISVRDQRTRWGSASRQGRLAFSWRLILAPPEALETVVIHELAHLRVFGHGPRFWAVVASRRVDHAKWRRWLHDHSTELHGALDEAPGPLTPERTGHAWRRWPVTDRTSGRWLRLPARCTLRQMKQRLSKRFSLPLAAALVLRDAGRADQRRRSRRRPGDHRRRTGRWPHGRPPPRRSTGSGRGPRHAGCPLRYARPGRRPRPVRPPPQGPGRGGCRAREDPADGPIRGVRGARCHGQRDARAE